MKQRCSCRWRGDLQFRAMELKPRIPACLCLALPAGCSLALLLAAAGLSACGGGGGGSSPPPPALPTVSISLNTTGIVLGGSAMLNWSSANATACTASGAWSGSQALSGSVSETPASAGTQTYTLTCTGPGGSADSSATLTVSAPNATFSGTVMDGGNPIAGASVTVYASSSGAALGSGLSGSSGQFSFSIVNPGGSAILYAVAAGGSSGQTANPAIKLLSVLGPGESYSSSSSFVINELGTVASVWPLAQFLDANGALSGPAASLAIAAATAANLADVDSGTPAAAIQSAPNTPDQIDTLANLLAACVASSGSASSECAGLFANSTAPGAAAPADTLAAALSIALHPGANVAALYALAGGSTAYSPALTTAPTDWTVSLNFSGGGLSEPTQVALDARGNVWVANYNSAVAEFAPNGAAISPAQGYTGGGLEVSFGIAIDGQGNVCVSNEPSGGAGSGNSSVTELSASGAILSGASGYGGGGMDFPDAIAIDASGNVWTANYGNSTVSEISSSGAALSPNSGFGGGGLSFPSGLAFDGAGNLWVADNGANQVSEFSSAGAALSPSAGYSGGGIKGPQAVALDQAGNVWVANYYGSSVSELDGANSAAPGAALSPASGYTGGGLATPGGIAIDGLGNVWVCNYNGNSVSELAGASAAVTGAALSPATGFTGTGLLQPFSPAIDRAGNLWTANFGNNSLTEFVGVAAPVKTPLLGLPQAP